MHLNSYLACLYWNGFNLKELEIIILAESKNEEKIQFINEFLKIDSGEILKAEAEKLQNWLSKKHAVLLTPYDNNYPKSLLLHSRPPFLCIWGQVDLLNQNVLSIVGSRSPSIDCRSWLRSELIDFLQQTKVPVVSGGARGVDMEVHKTCLAVGNPTLCFLPSGMSSIYPPELYHWIEPILESGGAVISPFHPFCRIFKSHFHLRNEFMVLVSKATFVVEAKLRSGSMLTANKSIKWGREVATLPVCATKSYGHGNLKLLQEGAQMIVSAEDLKTFWARNSVSCLVKFV